MKFTVTMKDPDTLHEAINEAVNSVAIDGLTEYETQAVRDIRMHAISELCQKWFEYGEYLTVEIDTEAETATVKAKP